MAPNLLFWPGSVLAIDPKGELASLTASRRSPGGSVWSLPMTPGVGEVHALDPFERVTGPARQFAGAFNPLADLDPESERGLDLAWMIADALVIQSHGDGAHWTHPAIQTTGPLTLAPAGLSPAEHASLRWTHNRTCRVAAAVEAQLPNALASMLDGARFTAYCREKGFKNSTLTARLIREHLDREGYAQCGGLLRAIRACKWNWLE